MKNLSADDFFALAVRHHQNGNYVQAELIYQHVLHLLPTHCPSLGNLGLLNLQLNRDNEAKKYLCRAVTVDPKYYEGYTNLGNLYFKQSCYRLAINSYRESIRIAPNDPDIWANLGNVYLKIKKDNDAIVCYKKAIELNPNRADLHNLLADCNYILARYSEAILSYENTLKINPNYAECYYKIGQAYQQIGQHHQAIKSYKQSVSVEPKNAEFHSQLGTTLLLTGDFKNGWMEYEWRRKIGKYKKYFAEPFWQGNDLAGKTLLVYAEQGMGDTIQFYRFISLLEHRNCTVILECHPPLKPLFEAWGLASETVQIFAIGEKLPNFDFYLPLMSFPYVLGLENVDQIPLFFPSQVSDVLPNMPLQIPLEKRGNLKIGLVWAGNPNHNRDKQRSMKLNQLSSLFDIPNCVFFSLQVGESRTELYQMMDQIQGLSITDLGQTFSNFVDTAMAVSQLDLVVSVDTAVAHLAATMGKPTWIMLSANPDWRWLLQRSDCPWYPTVRLFRQQVLGDWSYVVASIADVLSKNIKKRK